MPVKQKCKPFCLHVATWGCDYPPNAANGAIHFNGGGLNRFEVKTADGWSNASFDAGAVIRVRRVSPWEDEFYQIGSNGTSFTRVDKDLTLNVCGNQAEEVNLDEHMVVMQRCVPTPDDCDRACDCLGGAQEPEGISLQQLSEIIGPIILNDLCLPEPQQFNGCGDNNTVVLNRDENGCWKLGILSEAAKRGYTGTSGQTTQDWFEQNEVTTWFDALPDSANPYTIEDLRADDDAGDGTISENRLQYNILSEKQFTLPCRTRFNYRSYLNTAVNASEGFETLAGKRVYRGWRYRVDGGDWIYGRSNTAGPNTIGFGHIVAGTVIGEDQKDAGITLPAGDIHFQQFYVFHEDQANTVNLFLRTAPLDSGSYSTPGFTFTPIVD